MIRKTSGGGARSEEGARAEAHATNRDVEQGVVKWKLEFNFIEYMTTNTNISVAISGRTQYANTPSIAF
jgi:hypothetical protein